jgi:hypothetical protein
MRHWVVLVLFLLGLGTLRLVACGEESCVEDEDCNDGDPCTGDRCPEPPLFDFSFCGADDEQTCQHSREADGTLCGSGKVCVDGVCGENLCEGDVCDDDACTVGTCDYVDGTCDFTPIVCDDYKECTQDTCDLIDGCVFSAVEDGTECSYGMCEAGSCVPPCDLTSDEAYQCPIIGLEDLFCCPHQIPCQDYCGGSGGSGGDLGTGGSVGTGGTAGHGAGG